jgi:N-acetyltransferase 10
MYDLLCLDSGKVKRSVAGCPAPQDCELYHVNRDTLFSHHRASEAFLHHLMALYVSSHYKNTPNDLQLLSDAPAHQVFVLVPPVLPSATSLPDILCVLQVSTDLPASSPPPPPSGVHGGRDQPSVCDEEPVSWEEGIG